ncbi:MAG: Gfo/Idh/MocA family oxidoreductase [Verrucomicrobiota bacterium]
MTQQPFRLNRRAFLQRFGVTALTAPFIARGLLADSPNEKVNHASFGANGMAWSDLSELCKHPSFHLQAVAEVDLNRTKHVKERFPEARIYQDWREMLEKEKGLDSVNVSTPDHMHAPMGMSAMQLGYHVYGQKPLTHDLYETRQLTNAAREKRLVTQMGIQIHSSWVYRLGVRLIQDFAIGKVREVHTWSSKKWGDTGPMPTRVDPVPAEFNWDAWLGVCEPRPFIGDGWYHPANWRKRLDFGTGTFGDMGCHIYDPVFKALALTAPVSVRSEGPAPNEHSWAIDAVIHYVFPGTAYTEGESVKVTWYDGDARPPADVLALLGDRKQPDQGSIFIGTKGVMVLPHVDKPILLPADQFKDYSWPQISGNDHWAQFIDACMGKGQTAAHFGYAGPLTEAVLLGSVATRFPHTTLQWNAPRLTFDNVPEANRFVRRQYRAGWEVKGLS